MLAPGDTAPEFALNDEAGNPVTLSAELRRGPVLLYFYPADFTPGCTREACALRDLHPALTARGVVVLGISPQDEASHARFRARHRLPFRLLADPDRRVIRAWECEGPFGLVRRTTYLVSAQAAVLAAVRADLRIARHRRFAERTAASRPG